MSELEICIGTPPDPQERFGHIYFILASNSEAMKIGFSNDPWARCANLQTGSPEPLTLYFTWPATYSVEAALHAKFKHLHMHGEWFRATDELYNYLDDLGDELEP